MLRRSSFLFGAAFSCLTLLLVTDAWAVSKVKILHTFQGGKDGARPWATLLLDDKTGTLYGTTEDGGNQSCQNSFDTGCGIVFSLTPSGTGWKYRVLYRFQGGDDGGDPRAPLVTRPDGYFYSTTTGGGGSGCNGYGCGTAFRIKPGTWTEEVLLGFSSYQKGWYPQGKIAFDRKGNLYGLTVSAGTDADGVAFELTPNVAGKWKETILYDNAGLPYAGVIIDHLGNVYGTTDANGMYHEGSVFELSHGKRGWQYTDIYSFQDPCGTFCGGTQPGDLTADENGNFFGFAALAGLAGCGNGYGCGTVFEMTENEGTWQENTLYQFRDSADGWGPGYGAPTFDRAGNLYGATQAGGKHGFGTVFKLSPVKGGWKKTTLYSFPGGAGGAEPIGGLVVGRQGNIFGTTYIGGVQHCKGQGCGIVFEITP
jgi:uncharacterized repeat protein (TIGR03803 family)